MVIDFKKDNEVNLFDTFKEPYDAMNKRKKVLCGIALSNMCALLSISSPEEKEWIKDLFNFYLGDNIEIDKEVAEEVLTMLNKTLESRGESSDGP